MNKRLVTFSLAPRNPNINGIYYDEDSYKRALIEYFKKDGTLCDRYDNDTQYYHSDSNYIVGKVLRYYHINNGISDMIEAELDERLQFITSKEYVIGFKLIANGTIYDKTLNKEKYIIDKILYATLINKEFL